MKFKTLPTAATLVVFLYDPTPAFSDFNYPDFTSTAGLNLVGSAALSGSTMRINPASANQAGGVWFGLQQWVVGGFSTTFTFRITNPIGLLDANGNPGGDGFAFVVQNLAAAPVGSNNYIGYDFSNSLAVEFDTWNNTNLSDPNGNHISIHTKGTGLNDFNETTGSLATTGIATLPDMSDGSLHTARITYVSNLMSVYLDDMTTPRVTVNYDLNNIGLNNGNAWVGFTAGTGGAAENHDIAAWSFTGVPEPTSPLLLLSSAILFLRRRSLRTHERNDKP